MAYGRQQQISGGRFRPQAWTPLSTYQITALCPVAATQGRHATVDKLSADIAHPRHSTSHNERHVVTLRYEARAEREARDTRTGLAAEPLVIVCISFLLHRQPTTTVAVVCKTQTK